MFQILAKRGPDSRLVVEAITEALVSKLNSRRSEYVMVQVKVFNLEANIEANTEETISPRRRYAPHDMANDKQQ